MLCIESENMKTIRRSYSTFSLIIVTNEFLSEKGLRIRRMSIILLYVFYLIYSYETTVKGDHDVNELQSNSKFT